MPAASATRVLQTLYNLSDDDVKTIWLFREQPAVARAIERLFERFGAVLRDAGYLAMRGDRERDDRPRPTVQARQGRGGDRQGRPPAEGWSEAKRAQMDTGRRWTIERSRHAG